MQLSDVKKSIKNVLSCLWNWLSDFFNENPSEPPKQLIPVRHDNKKSVYHHQNQDYELNILKILLVIITSLLLIFSGVNLVFE